MMLDASGEVALATWSLIFFFVRLYVSFLFFSRLKLLNFIS